MSESDDDEIFDDEELSESENESGSIKDDEMGSEFNESGQREKEASDEDNDDFADPTDKKKEPETNAKGDFVTVPV